MLTPVVQWLLLINGALFLAEQFWFGPLVVWFALWPEGWLSNAALPLGAPSFWPWQLITYGFLHGGVLHLALNMYALWLFGTRLEYLWGSKRFAAYYLLCVVGAALAQMVVSEIILAQGGDAYPVLGASGGVFGVLLAFGLTYPEARLMLLFPPIPIKAKWFVLIYGAIELAAGVTGTLEGVAHFAHLGGMLTGVILLYRWRLGPWGRA
jgi:membrane associated rhomboid family serine protease